MKKSLITRLKSALCAVGLSVTLLTGQAYTCYAAATAAATAAVVVGGAVAISLVLAGLGLKTDDSNRPAFNNLVDKIAKKADVVKNSIGVGNAVEDVTKRGVAAYIKDGITYIPKAFADSVANAALDEGAFEKFEGEYSSTLNSAQVGQVISASDIRAHNLSDFDEIRKTYTMSSDVQAGFDSALSKLTSSVYNSDKYFYSIYFVNRSDIDWNIYIYSLAAVIGSTITSVSYSPSSAGNNYALVNPFFEHHDITIHGRRVSDIRTYSSNDVYGGVFINKESCLLSGAFSTYKSGSGFANTGSIPKRDGIGDTVSLPGNWAKPADIDVGLDTPIKAVPIDIGTSAKAASLAIPQIWSPRALAQTYGLAAGYGTKAIPNVPAIPRAKVWGGDITLPKDIPIPAIPGNPAIPQEKVQNPTAEDTPTTPTPVPDTPIPAAGIPNENNFMLPDSIKEKFPFCIPFDMAKAFQKLSTSGREAPKFDYKLRGVNGKEHYEFKVDLSNYDSAARVLRTGLYIVFVIGLAAASVYLIKH